MEGETPEVTGIAVLLASEGGRAKAEASESKRAESEEEEEVEVEEGEEEAFAIVDMVDDDIPLPILFLLGGLGGLHRDTQQEDVEAVIMS